METQKILRSMNFPAKRKDIIEQAKRSRAIPNILRELGLLPDRKYNSAEEVARELGVLLTSTFFTCPIACFFSILSTAKRNEIFRFNSLDILASCCMIYIRF